MTGKRELRACLADAYEEADQVRDQLCARLDEIDRLHAERDERRARMDEALTELARRRVYLDALRDRVAALPPYAVPGGFVGEPHTDEGMDISSVAVVRLDALQQAMDLPYPVSRETADDAAIAAADRESGPPFDRKAEGGDLWSIRPDADGRYPDGSRYRR